MRHVGQTWNFAEVNASKILAKRTGIDLVSICPTMVFGHVMQQHTVNTGTLALATYCRCG
ncbi:hypothetical protein Bca4012_083443 [Brassica carinata]|uniref:Uncharacterized protein n=1 Tax=Brassica carinata TaxID=52824 RepID=A0A8X7SJL1_BRACI|nr:hypothetical protein Bca52824_027285 [Brassica carinata]